MERKGRWLIIVRMFLRLFVWLLKLTSTLSEASIFARFAINAKTSSNSSGKQYISSTSSFYSQALYTLSTWPN
jgi:hypothetical protein